MLCSSNSHGMLKNSVVRNGLSKCKLCPRIHAFPDTLICPLWERSCWTAGRLTARAEPYHVHNAKKKREVTACWYCIGRALSLEQQSAASVDPNVQSIPGCQMLPSALTGLQEIGLFHARSMLQLRCELDTLAI
eukprot:6201465-Pleurochrysis_carterae.AAC.4